MREIPAVVYVKVGDLVFETRHLGIRAFDSQIIL